MKGLAAIAAGLVGLSLLVAGYNLFLRPPLLVTSTAPSGGCTAPGIDGTLEAGSTFGTLLHQRDGSKTPVVWPSGYAARRVWLQVQVLDTHGTVVATTGEHAALVGTTGIEPGWDGRTKAGMPQGVLYVCGSA